MAKFHITRKGEPGVCHASYNCPLGGDDEHYGTRQEAAKAFEQKMTEQLIPAGAQKEKLGLAALNKLARVSTDRELLETAVENGSDRTFKQLSANPEAPGDLLVAARDKASNDEVKTALLGHRNFPVASMNGEEFAQAYALATKKKFGGAGSANYLTSSDAFSDEHLEALEANPPKDYLGKPRTVRPLDALANPNNKLSDEKRIKLAETDPYALAAAQKSGKYPSDRIENLSPKTVYWGNVYRSDNPEYLDGYGKWAIAHRDDHKASDIASHVARNEKTPSETLDKLARAGFAPQEVFKNPNTSDETKDYLAHTDVAAASLWKIEKLEKARGGDLKKSLMADVDPRTDHPYGRYRGYYTTTVHFDPAKVKEAGLTASDMMVLMNARNYNAGVRYDEATGVFTGTVDSTD